MRIVPKRQNNTQKFDHSFSESRQNFETELCFGKKALTSPYVQLIPVSSMETAVIDSVSRLVVYTWYKKSFFSCG